MESLASPQTLRSTEFYEFLYFSRFFPRQTHMALSVWVRLVIYPVTSTRGDPCVFTGVCEPALNEEWGEPSISELIS